MSSPDIAPLTEIGWLASQPPDYKDWIATNGRWIRCRPGQVLYDAGEEPDGLYGLAEGALEVTLPLVGDEPVTLHRAEPGFWIGESALLAETTRLISLCSAVDSRVLRVPAASIRALVSERPDTWRAFYELSHINTTTAVTLLAEALALTARARLARVILRLVDDDGRVDARQEDLARLIGMTRSSLQRALQSLEDADAITRGYGRVIVQDRARLARISHEI